MLKICFSADLYVFILEAAEICSDFFWDWRKTYDFSILFLKHPLKLMLFSHAPAVKHVFCIRLMHSIHALAYYYFFVFCRCMQHSCVRLLCINKNHLSNHVSNHLFIWFIQNLIFSRKRKYKMLSKKHVRAHFCV